MVLPLLVFSSLFALLTADVLFPKKEEKKTAEQELGEALAKYLSDKTKKCSRISGLLSNSPVS